MDLDQSQSQMQFAVGFSPSLIRNTALALKEFSTATAERKSEIASEFFGEQVTVNNNSNKKRKASQEQEEEETQEEKALIQPQEEEKENNKKKDSDGNNIECYQCTDTFQRCECCKKNYMCGSCIDQGIELEEWLTVDGVCTKCKERVCRDCITICYSCCNNSQESKELCKTCTVYTKVDCEYHDWYVCKKEHEGDDDDADTAGCGQCKANKNYHLRMS